MSKLSPPSVTSRISPEPAVSQDFEVSQEKAAIMSDSQELLLGAKNLTLNQFPDLAEVAQAAIRKIELGLKNSIKKAQVELNSTRFNENLLAEYEDELVAMRNQEALDAIEIGLKARANVFETKDYKKRLEEVKDLKQKFAKPGNRSNQSFITQPENQAFSREDRNFLGFASA